VDCRRRFRLLVRIELAASHDLSEISVVATPPGLVLAAELA
jgi:hypothetical protein